MKRFLREPLVHFLVLGAALFALDALRSDAVEARGRIVVTQGDVEHLATLFARTRMRPPTADELRELVDDHVREEAAYREALELGLDRDDTIVRRRLRQKLEFLAEDVTTLAEPTDAELAAFLRSQPGRFAREARTSFEHVLVSRERRGERAEAEARELLAQLRTEPGRAAELGDPTLLPPELRLAETSEIDAVFGTGFASALDALETERWSGPVESSYGLHLVRVEAREAGRVPSLEEVRDEVLREVMAERRREGLARFYDGILARYEVVVELEDGTTGGTAALPAVHAADREPE